MRCGMPPWDARVGTLSGGEKRRVALCRLLLTKPDMLLLDEPTNHLDAESVEWLEQYLQRFGGTVVAITHDRYFLDNAAEWILELDRGHGIPWKGNYSSWLEQKEQRLAQEEATESARRKALKRELEWVRSGPKGRHAKSKSRIARFEELSSYEYQRRNETSEIFIPVAERLGDTVIRFKNVTKGFGDRVLIDDLSFDVPPGAIVGIIGPNGAGKTTLFRMIAGTEKPDAGTIEIGPTVKLAVVDQSREALDDEKTAFEEIGGGNDLLMVGRFEMPARAYLGRFNFKGGDQQKAGGNAFRRRTRPSPSREDAVARRGQSCCSTNRPTTSTSRRCVRSKTRSPSSPAACWSSATIVGSSTGSRRTSSRSKTRAAWSSTRATIRSTRPTSANASATKPRGRTASATSRSCAP